MTNSIAAFLRRGPASLSGSLCCPQRKRKQHLLGLVATSKKEATQPQGIRKATTMPPFQELFHKCIVPAYPCIPTLTYPVAPVVLCMSSGNRMRRLAFAVTEARDFTHISTGITVKRFSLFSHDALQRMQFTNQNSIGWRSWTPLQWR